MIVNSSITVYLNRTTAEKTRDCVDELRSLCNALIDDDVLSEQILTAALEQSGLQMHSAGDRVISMWARRLVIKDCIAAAKAISNSTDSHYVEPLAMGANPDRVVGAPENPPAETQLSCLRAMAVVPRFVFALRTIEGYAYAHIANLLGVGEAECELAYSTAVEQIRNLPAPAKRADVLTVTGHN